MNERLAGLYRQLDGYEPFNGEEAADRRAFMGFVSRNDDCLSCDNLTGHLTASVWVVDGSNSQVLMEYHNIYDSWSWIGGHADGDADLAAVALRELREETGVADGRLAQDGIFSLEVLHVQGHYKHGAYVPSHLHYNVTYLVQADPSRPVFSKPDENSGVRWFSADRLMAAVSERWMAEHVYAKLMAKAAKVYQGR